MTKKEKLFKELETLRTLRAHAINGIYRDNQILLLMPKNWTPRTIKNQMIKDIVIVN